MATHSKVLDLNLDPKLTYSTHIHNISVQAHKPIHTIQSLTTTGWGIQKETLMATYKAVMRPALEYASSIWSSLASGTSNIPQQSKAKNTNFNNGRYTTNFPTDPHTVTTTDIKTNMRHIHTSIVSRHLATRGNNKILRTPPPPISSSEEILPRLTHSTLAQLRTNNPPLLKSYLHKVDATSHPSPLYHLYNTHTHDTYHLFNFTHIRTTLAPLDL